MQMDQTCNPEQQPYGRRHAKLPKADEKDVPEVLHLAIVVEPVYDTSVHATASNGTVSSLRTASTPFNPASPLSTTKYLYNLRIQTAQGRSKATPMSLEATMRLPAINMALPRSL
jgi:hypothetical protein